MRRENFPRPCGKVEMLTGRNTRNRFTVAVLKRHINILLILAIGSSAVLGMPVHSRGGDSMMACCKAALEQSKSPRVAAARLCCAMNCDEPGPTSSASSQSFFQNSLQPSLTVGLALPTAASYEWPAVPYARSDGNSQPATFSISHS